jgi:Transposase DDE domain group 1
MSSKHTFPTQEGTSRVKRRRSSPRLSVTTGGKGIVAHAGARLLCDLADELGLTEGLSEAMAPTKKRRRGHDRGHVLVDLAVAVADGATTLSDLRVLNQQPQLFGEVASVSTTWRTLEAIDPPALARIAMARAQARRTAWAEGMDPGFYVIDIDGTLVTSDSDFKQGAAATYKKGFGFYPLMSYLDATGEPLAGKLRPGNAGSGTAADYVEVLDDSLAQLPVNPAEEEIIARSDSAGCSHEFLDACRDRQVRFCVGHPLTEAMARAVTAVSERSWIPALSADGSEVRDGAEVAEMTHLVDLSGWPPGTRAIARREDPHPGAQLTFTDVDGHRYQVFLTDLADPDICYLEGVYRGRGRAECSIRDAKDTGLANLPSADFAINQAWLTVVLLAGDLLATLRGLCLEGDLARAEPKRLRYCLLHAPGVLIHSARRTILRIADAWPWADDLVGAFGRLPHWAIT